LFVWKNPCLFLLRLFLFWGGASVPESNKNGFLQGHISIGPICPVERNPPDPNCQPTEQTYLAYSFTVYKIGAGDPGPRLEIIDFHGDKNGNYLIELPEGTYEIMNNLAISGYVKTVEIKAGQTTGLDISLDTGIR
ncbi:MAG: carboxypeptidase-like regulatory domain-containing protein, partial [archaeon]|nr:carboxypeptidase-like regulatory domain-containing protein [archaeon]